MCKLKIDERRWLRWLHLLRWLREPFPRPPAAVYTEGMMMGPGSGFMFGLLIQVLAH